MVQVTAWTGGSHAVSRSFVYEVGAGQELATAELIELVLRSVDRPLLEMVRDELRRQEQEKAREPASQA
jgi:DNA-binding protein Fis